jgi:hypothetical protein
MALEGPSSESRARWAAAAPVPTPPGASAVNQPPAQMMDESDWSDPEEERAVRSAAEARVVADRARIRAGAVGLERDHRGYSTASSSGTGAPLTAIEEKFP